MQGKSHTTERNYGLGRKLNEKCILAKILKQILIQILLDRETQWILLNKRVT